MPSINKPPQEHKIDWANSGALKHHCPCCGCPLGREAAKRECLGKHVEWCHRYHALTRLTWAKDCQACRNCNGQHHQRHREIAELWIQIKKPKNRTQQDPTATLGTPGTTLDVINVSDSMPRTKKEKKAAKKASKASTRDKVVTSAEIDEVARILHPDGHRNSYHAGIMAADLTKTMEARLNVKYKRNDAAKAADERSHGFMKEGERERKINKKEVIRVLAALEIDPAPRDKDERQLVAQLTAAIARDLLSFLDEMGNTAEREEAFWVWAPREAHDYIMANGGDWDFCRDGKPTILEAPLGSIIDASQDGDEDGNINEDLEAEETEPGAQEDHESAAEASENADAERKDSVLSLEGLTVTDSAEDVSTPQRPIPSVPRDPLPEGPWPRTLRLAVPKTHEENVEPERRPIEKAETPKTGKKAKRPALSGYTHAGPKR